jgi:hypothetical protein
MAQARNRVTTSERRRTRGVIQELAESAGKDRDARAVLDRLDARAVLDRLEKDVDALDAIAAITKEKVVISQDPRLDAFAQAGKLADDPDAKDVSSVRTLLELCLYAAYNLLNYREVLRRVRAGDGALRKNRESVRDLRRLIEGDRYLHHPMVDWMPPPETEQKRIERIASYPRAATAGLQEQRSRALVPGSAEYFRDALDRFDALIDQRQRLREKPMFDLVVSREAATPAAAEKAAIGWLADQVKQTFGKPHTRHVATLAGVALDIGEVSEKRVQKALSARMQKLP